MRLSGALRQTGKGLGLVLAGTAGGFVAGLLRRHRPSRYVTERRAPAADTAAPTGGARSGEDG